jgi:hypothetical protein
MLNMKIIFWFCLSLCFATILHAQNTPPTNLFVVGKQTVPVLGNLMHTSIQQDKVERHWYAYFDSKLNALSLSNVVMMPQSQEAMSIHQYLCLGTAFEAYEVVIRKDKKDYIKEKIWYSITLKYRTQKIRKTVYTNQQENSRVSTSSEVEIAFTNKPEADAFIVYLKSLK